MEQADEILRALEEAKGGFWLPLTLMAGSFSIIIGLLLYIWNGMLKNLNKALDNQREIQTIVARHDVEIEHLKEK